MKHRETTNNKIEHIKDGDFVEHRTFKGDETSGPARIAEYDGRKVVLVPGRWVKDIAVQQHRILAIFRDGKEIIRF